MYLIFTYIYHTNEHGISMENGISPYIWLICMVNVGKYTIFHGSHGIEVNLYGFPSEDASFKSRFQRLQERDSCGTYIL